MILLVPYVRTNHKHKSLSLVPLRLLLVMEDIPGVLDKLVRMIKNYMKSEPTISTQKFVAEGGKIYANSRQTNIKLYLVKIFLNQVEIGRYLPTYLDGIMITQKQ